MRSLANSPEDVVSERQVRIESYIVSRTVCRKIVPVEIVKDVPTALDIQTYPLLQ